MSGWLSMVCSPSRIPTVEQLVYWSLAVDFFNHLNMLYGTVTEFCIPQEVRCYSLHCLVPPNLAVSCYVCWSSVRWPVP